jgi:pyruvate dehydrogenase E2 component (dihydrolipoamide acetyltransferase)
MARELGVDIHAVHGSGPGGRISEADVKAHVRERLGGPGQAVAADAEPDLPDFSRWGEVESRELSTVRRITAQSTTISWRTVPHVTQFDEADITQVGPFVEKHAKRVGQAGGKLTVTAVVTKVCAQALRKFPRFNASIDLKRERLILKKYVHIGMAVDTPRGLLMPVIRDADAKSITQLAVEIVDLAERSRNKKIKPTELEGGSFSISNQGGIGGVGFTPIVLWPQVAILGISRSAVEPRFIDGQFQPRKVLPLSLSYDHRIIDGADAARFLRWICDSLEQPLTLYL